MSTDIQITASVPTLTTTGVHMGVDVTVAITAGDREWSGGVTLVRDRANNEWGSWGDIFNWCSPELLSAIRALVNCDHLRAVMLSEIVGEARHAIESDPDIGKNLLNRELDRLAQDEAEDADEAMADCG